MLIFRPISQHHIGTIASLLLDSYAELLSTKQSCWQKEKQTWLQFDSDVFSHPATIGHCVFLTCLNNEVIGFSSFDPRHQPAFGVIGHNCIHPRFRGQGYGKQQIFETLNRFRLRGIKKAFVSTSEHPFFIPAQKMYLASGFRETRRYTGGPDPRYRVIEYELVLS